MITLGRARKKVDGNLGNGLYRRSDHLGQAQSSRVVSLVTLRVLSCELHSHIRQDKAGVYRYGSYTLCGRFDDVFDRAKDVYIYTHFGPTQSMK
jgi:hypothetical protein